MEQKTSESISGVEVKIGVDEGEKFKMRIRMQIGEIDRKKEMKEMEETGRKEEWLKRKDAR
jgi:hypothetical protein